MILAINQPTYFSWIGQFDLIDQVDKYVFYDDVQIVKQSWDTRNKILTKNGPLWISIPLIHNLSHKDKYFNSTLISKNEIWKIKQCKTIKFSYAKAKYFSEIMPIIEDLIINNKHQTIGDFNKHIIKTISEKIGIKTDFISSSSLTSTTKKKDSRLVEICKGLKAKRYLSPMGASVYIEKSNREGAFFNSGIKLMYQNYVHPRYQQLLKPFTSHLSIIDLLFNEGLNNSLKIIRQGRKKSIFSNEL